MGIWRKDVKRLTEKVMEEKDTYQRVAIPMTDKQAHEAFACETCKGFDGSLQWLKEFADRVKDAASMEMYFDYHKHLDLVASPDCGGQCVTGETMSILCPCCKDSVYFNYSCFLPTEIECIHCSADLTGGDHAHQRTIRKIIKNHNEMKWVSTRSSVQLSHDAIKDGPFIPWDEVRNDMTPTENEES